MKRLVVLGTMAANPFAGMAWMTMQIAVGMKRLGHDVYYIETTSDWPYDPERGEKSNETDYPLRYLASVAEAFGLGDRWAYRRSYADRVWLGPVAAQAASILIDADAVFNIAGATSLAEDGLSAGRLVLFGTDPVVHELRYANGDARIRALVDEHSDVVTYGENIGTAASPVPPLPRLRARLRQPILLDLWETRAPGNGVVTTVGNWKQVGLDIDFGGRTYRWSKHHEWLRFIDLPARSPYPLELAMNLDRRQTYDPKGNEEVPAFGLEDDSEALLRSHGWRLTDSVAMSTRPWPYRRYIQESAAEFTVARDINVSPRSGWFSERSACYLAAGRPVITQDTGFGATLPTGEGLFAVADVEEAGAALEQVAADPDRHGRAARAIAVEYFRAETVLGRMLVELGL